MTNPLKSIKTDEQTVEGLETVSKSGSPVRRRFRTAQAAYNVFTDLLRNYDLVAGTRAKIQGMYDGNPPYDNAELLRLGQSYRCNVNFREMESIIDANTAAAWSLHLDVNTLIEVRMNPLIVANDPLSVDWASVIEEEYTRLLLKWNGFYTNLNLSIHEYFLFGVGFSVWPDEWDWRSKSFKSGNALVPGMAPTDIDKLELLMIRDMMSAGDLYRILENKDTAISAGWNTAAIKELLVRTYVEEAEPSPNGQDPAQTSPWESLQQKLKNGDPDMAVTEFEGVRIVHVLVKEVYGDKKVSHFILAEDDGLQSKWLYEGYQKYERMRNVAWMLPYSYSDGYLRSSKGMGHRSFPHCEFSNRLLCTTFDGGSLAASLLVQPKTGLDAARLSLVRMGPITMLPENLSVVQTSFMPNVASLVQIRGLSKDILHNNTGVFRPRNELTADAPKTAQQVRSEENKEARFERNQVEHFYTNWQLWHEETFRRLTRKDYINSSLDLPGKEEAKEFIDRCVDRGVPKKVLFDPKSMDIVVSRAIGMGSPSVKMDITNSLQAMKGSMGEEGRNQADREWASARLGQWNVNKFFPRINRDNIPSNAGSFAVMENNDMAEGQQSLVGEDQLHYIHITYHFDRIQGVIKAAQEGQMEPMAAVQELMISLPHVSQHIQFLSKDISRKAQVSNAVDMLKSFNKIFIQLQAVVKQQMAQEQQAQEEAAMQQESQGPQLSGEDQVKMAKVQGDLQLEAFKQKSLNSMREMKTQEQMQIKRVQTDVSNALKASQVSAELERKSRLLEADLAIKNAQAQK